MEQTYKMIFKENANFIFIFFISLEYNRNTNKNITIDDEEWQGNSGPGNFLQMRLATGFRDYFDLALIFLLLRFNLVSRRTSHISIGSTENIVWSFDFPRVTFASSSYATRKYKKNNNIN